MLEKQPEKSIPDACQNWATTKATYQLFDHQKITTDVIQISHFSNTIERSFKRKLYDYDIEHTRVRSRTLCTIFLGCFCQHLDAWEAHSSLNILEFVSAWLAKAA